MALTSHKPSNHAASLATQGRALLTDVEAAARLGLKPSTLRQWRLVGGGPQFVRLGSAVRYRPEDIEAFVAQRLVRA